MNTAKFQNIILKWYTKYGRHTLPWRRARDPYKIFISELMLQQTQVERVIPKYRSFLRMFPTVRQLASAPTGSVLRAWSGLGYNRRALYAKRAAEEIVRKYGGSFPHGIVHLESLPGIGPYTARAIAVFSWRRPEIVLETNIRRVFIHFFFRKKKKVSDAEIQKIIKATLPEKHPHEWYWALMDYGARALKTIPNPNKKSRQYARQSRFEGSRRQARAQILKNILKKNKGVSAHDIAQLFSADKNLRPYRKLEKIRELFSELEKEGFLSKQNAVWTIRK